MISVQRIPEIPSPPAQPPMAPEAVPVRRMEPPMVFVAPAWEYRQLYKPVGETPSEAELNTLGVEGWELAGVSPGPEGVHFYFKRQLR
jgi:hypothetical protein